MPKNLLGNALRMMQGTLKLPFDFASYARKHIFNKISRHSEYGYYFFPYGYLFRYPRWGVINEMGFRCRENIHEIRPKYPDHLIVAVFGGSTGFSILVPDEAAFAGQLDALLNADAGLIRAAGGRPFKVVNLSQPGNLLIGEIINYVLYAAELKPDIVITHSGCNDMVYGQTSDRRLLSKYAIGYLDVMEAWAKKIHDCDDVPIDYDLSDPASSDFAPVKPVNRPEDVVRAYHTRVTQFAGLAEGNGARFIHGFQPSLMSKKAYSPAETESRRKYQPYFQLVYDNIPQLYDLYERILNGQSSESVINLHSVFRQLGAEETHFGDTWHTLEPGDRVIAREYHKKIRSFYIPALSPDNERTDGQNVDGRPLKCS